jgi:hypothetical protein
MAIVRETLDGGIVRTYSNAGVKVRGGFPEGDYNVVYDPEEAEREYVETDIPVEKETPDPDAPRVFSKLKIIEKADELGLATELIEMLRGNALLYEKWSAAVNLREDNASFASGLALVKQATGLTDEQIDGILAACVAD